MTSSLYTAPSASRARVVNRLWVNKAPFAGGNATSSMVRKMHPITRQNLPKHKAYRPPRRYK